METVIAQSVRMKRIALFLIKCACFAALCFSARAVAAATTIAVRDFDHTNADKILSGLMADRVRAILVDDSAYAVLERDDMEHILGEQGFQHAGCTTRECAVQIGQLLNTRYIITGKIRRISGAYSLDLSMIDVERGQVRAKSHYDCECSQQEFIAAAPGYCTSMLLNPDEMNKIRIPVPRRRRSKRIKTTSRILLAVAGCACFAAGYWCDMQVREQSRSMDEIGSQYMQSKDNSLYNALNSQHRHAWDDGNAWSIRRNMCYAASGACGAAIVITIAF